MYVEDTTKQMLKKGSQCRCKVTMRLVRATIVTVEQKEVLNIMNFCL